MLGDDRIRRFPSTIGEKREIRVEITTWKGISLGAKHYDVSVVEQENSWWSESENAWVHINEDSEKRGFHLNAGVLTEEQAVKVAKMFVGLIAGPKRKRHDVIWSGPGRPSWAT